MGDYPETASFVRLALQTNASMPEYVLRRAHEAMAENGITVDGEVTSGAAPQGQSPLTSVSSAQLNEIMAFMMRHSDNTLAEEFGRLTALAAGRENSPHGATQAVAATLQDLGVDTAQLTMADCSGLAPGSSLSVRTLIGVLQRLLDGGATIVVIEHDLDMIANADYVIDMGPGGGETGGRIVAEGTPAQVAANPESLTGRYLARELEG